MRKGIDPGRAAVAAEPHASLTVLIAEMYATCIEAIFPSEASDRPAPDAPAIHRFPTRL